MKKLHKLFSFIMSFVMVFAVLGGIDCTAVAQTSGEYEYNLLDDSTVEITKYKGKQANIVIPSEIDGYPVTTIADQALYFNSNIVTVEIPSTVKTIGVAALSACTKLTQIIVQEGNQSFISVNGVLYSRDLTRLVQYPAGKTDADYSVLKSVVVIEPASFLYCANLKSVNALSNLEQIGDIAFSFCTALNEITLPASLKTVGEAAFLYSGSIKDVYYTGTSEQWNAIEINSNGNASFTNATRHISFVPVSTEHNYKIISVIPAGIDTPEIVYYKCTDCGEETVIEYNLNLSDFAVKAVSLSLASNITMNYKVPKNAVADFENIRMEFTRNGKTVTVKDYKLQGSYIVFAYKNIAPQNMNDTVTAVLKATHNTVEYSSEVFEYSVAKYIYAMLDKCVGEGNEKLRTLLVDLLNYGAQAQLYQNYNVDNLVNSALSEAQKSWASTQPLDLCDSSNQAYETVEKPVVEWKTAGLQLNSSIAIKYKFTAQSIDDLTFVVTCGSNRQEFSSDEIIDNGDGTYSLIYDGVNADKMSKSIYITAYLDGKPVSNTMLYSIESYVKRIQSIIPDTELLKLTEAMMRYGKSAERYVTV